MSQEKDEEEQETAEKEPSEYLEQEVKIKKYKCKYCGQKFGSIPELGTHSKSCPERLKAKKKKMEEPEAPTKEEEEEIGGVPPPSATKMSPREYITLYGEEGLQKLKRDRLIEFLSVAPKVSNRIVTWILKQYDLDESARRDPNVLMSVLQSAGIKDHVAYRIVNVLNALEDEFADLLRRQAQPYGFYPSRRLGEGGYPPFPTRQPQSYRGESFPRYPQPQPPYYDYYSPQGYPPRVEDIVRQRIEEEFKKREPQSQPSQAQQVVTITEPLRDAEGKLVYDKDGNPVYRKVTGPMSQIGVVGQEDPELRFIKKLKEYKDLTKPEKTSELTEEKVRAVIKEEVGAKEEKITKEDIEKISTHATARVLATREEEDKEEKRFERLERAIRESAGGKTVEGYRDDAYRFLGQGLQTFATREPKTAKVVTDFLERIMYGQAPPSKEVQPGARESIFERLDQKYVAEE